MKRTILALSIFFIFLNLNGQEPQKPWINSYQETIVSLGKIENVKTQDNQSLKYFKIVGTGMLFYVNSKNKTIPCLITAKHIFEDSTNNWFPEIINLRLFRFQNEPLDKNLGEELKLKKDGKKLWVDLDKKTDLACLPLMDLEERLNISDLMVLPYSQFATTDHYFEGAPLLVFGYPGIVEENFRTRALVRQGVISWISPTSLEEGTILIDCDVFPGNSGGPVITVPSTINKYGSQQIGGSPRFLGIVSAKRINTNNLINSKGEMIRDQSGNLILTLESVGIGIIEPAFKVKKLLDKTKALIENNKY